MTSAVPEAPSTVKHFIPTFKNPLGLLFLSTWCTLTVHYLIKSQSAGFDNIISIHFLQPYSRAWHLPAAPHVDGRRVPLFSQQQLGRPVPQRDHLIGVGPTGERQDTSESALLTSHSSEPLAESGQDDTYLSSELYRRANPKSASLI